MKKYLKPYEELMIDTPASMHSGSNKSSRFENRFNIANKVII
jgi:hypothetical protein